MKNQNNNSALYTLVSVFFFWGFIAASNGVFIPFCKTYFSIDQFQSQLLNSIGFLPEQSSRANIYKGNGCDHCNNTGYKGRMGVYEILEINKSLKQAILSNLQQNELNALAKKNGFRPMQEMGHDLLLSGDLTFSEYSRVLQAN